MRDTWTNISGTKLPNLPVNCIVYQSYAKGSYIATDIGAAHKDSIDRAALFNTKLPHVSVRELEIQYNIGKLGPTYGRGGKHLIYSQFQ